MGMLTFSNLRKTAQKGTLKSVEKKEALKVADEKKSALKSSKKKVKENG